MKDLMMTAEIPAGETPVPIDTTTAPAPAEPAPADAPSQGPVQEAPIQTSGEVDFTSGWDALWATLTAGYPNIGATLTTIGLIIVTLSIIKWANAVRRGSSHKEGAKPVWGGLLIGSIFAAPTLIIPLILTVLEVVVSIGVSLVDKGIG